ncbi:MAG TPA: 50S ribosomal protein L35 [Solirubrobacteraceae bacterium]|nr:50S ribosomal protein L35 [Solirubrobacteraceae bacterium]
MPKMKTHSGAKKRFKVTATGKVRGRHAFTSHILEKKSPKHKRQLGTQAILADEDTPRVKRLLSGKSARRAGARARRANGAPTGGERG